LNAEPLPVAPFRWHDGERVIVFGRGELPGALELLERGYALLTTPRAAAAAEDLAAEELLQRASAVHEVAAGRVDEIATELRPRVEGEVLVALGGGRVIDVAKALAAADPPRMVAAIPTTLSGAEMTSIHRHARGVPAETPRVRPAILINDPAISASAPVAQLAQSGGNALGHALEGPATPLSNPVAAMAAVAAARLIAAGFASDAPDEQARDRLALGALLAGYAIGSTGYGLHHIVSQTLARFAGVGHGAANTIMLPLTVRALAGRAPEWIARVERELGSDPAVLAERLRELSGVTRLRDAGAAEEQLEICAEEASRRPELAMTPPPADLEELRELYRAAY
jgi:alcohol dehydrogenase class IV